MIPGIPNYMYEESIRKYRIVKTELESEPTQKLQGMVDTYSRMQPFVRIKSLFGSNDLDRLRLGKLILTTRELSQLTEAELRKEGASVSPLRDLLEFFVNSSRYSRREIALDLIGERKGKPYFVPR